MIPISDNVRDGRTPYVCILLVALNVMVFAWELSMPRGELRNVFDDHGVIPRRFTDTQWASDRHARSYAPFVTSLFLHAGWFHVIGNMWFLYLFGRSIELRMGRAAFVVLYLMCGICAGMIHVVANPASTVPTVGASGAIAGVLGAYLLFYSRARIVVVLPIFFFPLFFLVPAAFYLVLWFVMQLLSGHAVLSTEAAQSGGGVAWWAHVGGFVVGLSLASGYWIVEKLTGGAGPDVPHVVPLRGEGATIAASPTERPEDR